MSGDHGDERESGSGGDGSGGIEPLTQSDPRRIGPYPLIGRLGSGGMGRVYLARSEGGRTVAVKVVHEEHTSSGEFRARFRREIEAARRVGEHFTAPVLDADPDAARPWVATGYVPGPSLEQALLTYGPLPAPSVYALADGLLRALKGIHGAGIVHRDLKPSNVLLTVAGPKVIDFGIARALQVSVESLLTSTGMVIGSPGFMAPEQILGEETGTPADVFALGCVLMYAATGQLPFGHGASNQHTVMYRIVEAAPDLARVKDEPLRTFIARCLTKSPAERPGVDELLEAPERPRPSGAGKGAWLPPALVARLAEEAARLLDVEAPVTEAKEAKEEEEASETPGTSEPPGISKAPDVATFGLRAAPKPESEVEAEAEAEVTTAPKRPHRRTRRSWAMAVAVVAVLASGGTVALLDGDDGAQGAPGAEGTPPGSDKSPTSPAPSGSKGPDGKGKDGKDGEEKGKGDDSSPGKDDKSSGGGAADNDNASDNDPPSAGEDGGSDPKAPSGGGSSDAGGSGSGSGTGTGSGSGSDASDNRVPQGFAGTWALTSPYAQQPQKVIIYRVAPGGYAVKLITDSGNGGHCENQAKLVSVTDGGKRINIGTAHLDEGRSSQIVCGDLDPSFFTLDAPSGIRHNVGPAHGDGYHYDRA
ncbi:serine/threonine protein kinase [Streptomyces rectiviolaceus]|uniref:non-specific serine/threonine protein kinase n=1 Tax=Streptomyces rectiviolaceus TaxID=332591 RepID=A0ABP6MNQ5_9ACTN